MVIRLRRTGLVVVALLGLIALAIVGYVVTTSRAQGPRYRTVKLDRGVITPAVSATGALNAVITVQVGSQVSGQIKELRVDFNSPVKKGQLIARLDPDPFVAKVNAARADVENAQAVALNQTANVQKARADIENARAGVATAEANAARARADVENARAALATARANTVRDGATLANAKLQLDRSADLLRKQLIAQSDKDQAQMTFDTSQAQVEATRAQERASEAGQRSSEGQLAATLSQIKAAQAQVGSAEAQLQVTQAQLKAAEATVRNKQATLDQARFDLEHSEIRAPVDGVVISRAVDVGQTVAASLQAPTLFTIAQDLTRMQVEAAVDEADVGRLREGMPATFTVDAFPGRTFRGEIVQIRKAPLVVQNVVSYTTIIAVANPDGVLMPGMTANVRIQVERRDDVLRVANAALRFRLPSDAGGDATGPAAGAAPAPASSAPASGGPGPVGASPLRDMRDTLVKDLGLSAEQQGRLDGILGETRQSFQGLRSQNLDERGREAARKRIRDEIREKVRAILSPEQQKKYDAIAAPQDTGRRGGVGARAPGRVYVLGPDGKPRAVPIVIGVSDGSYTEVLQGDLQPGQEVVTGQVNGATSRSPSTPSGGPRLRL